MNWTGGKRFNKMRAGKGAHQLQREHFAKQKTEGNAMAMAAAHAPAVQETAQMDQEEERAMTIMEDQDEADSVQVDVAAGRHLLESSDWTLGLDEDMLPPLELERYQPSISLHSRHPAAALPVEEPATDMDDCMTHGQVANQESEQHSVYSLKENVSASSHLDSDDRLFMPKQADPETFIAENKRRRASSDELMDDPFNLAHLVSAKRNKQHAWHRRDDDTLAATQDTHRA